MKPFNLIVLLSAFLVSCEWIQMKKNPAFPEEPNPIARVQDKYLYERDLEGIANGAHPVDSANTVQRYVQNWIKKQLMLSEAAEQIEFDQAELQRKILDYRYALMVYEFEKHYINRNLKKEVSDAEIEEYYKNNQENFQLKQSIIRAVFLQIPKDSPKLREIKRNMTAATEKAKAQLKSLSIRYATKSHTDDEVWLKFDDVFNATPLNISNRVQFLRENEKNIIEAEDENYLYLVKIYDYKIKDEIPPLEFVKDDIKMLIINKRKTALAKQLEDEIYNQALENEDFEIYVKN